MRRYILPVLAIVLGLSSCDFLDRTPKDKLAPENYFRNEQDFKLFSNSFYNDLFNKEPYNKQSDVFFQKGVLSDELMDGVAREIPTGVGTGGWGWSVLRKINTMLGNMDKCDDQAVVKQYTGLAKFFRARFYYEKVKKFGDVPWYDRELGSKDPDLYKTQDSREFVMSKMLEDIDDAIESLPSAVSTYRVNRWAALMLKAQFCLYEGTYRKYRGLEYPEGLKSDDYLRLAAEAAEEIIDKGPYSFAADYGELFREPDADKNEFILAIRMDQAISCVHNSTAYACMATQGNPGFSKKFIDSFLMSDGSRFTDKEGWETMQFADEVKDRDPRLAAIIRMPDQVRSTDKYTMVGPDLSVTSSGFQMDKYVMDGSKYPTTERVDMSFNDIPVYRFAEAHLIYAEAKAELGQFRQDEADKSINKLRARVNMPKMVVDNLTVDPYLVSEKYGYLTLAEKNPSNLAALLEIRRERTIELVLEDSNRWDDIVRWKEGRCFLQPLQGIYFPGPGEYDLTGDGQPDILLYDTAKEPDSKISYKVQIQEIEIDGKYVPCTNGVVLSEGRSGYIDMHRLKNRSFDEDRDYLYPIPLEDRQLNPNLKQNPGWKDGLSEE